MTDDSQLVTDHMTLASSQRFLFLPQTGNFFNIRCCRPNDTTVRLASDGSSEDEFELLPFVHEPHNHTAFHIRARKSRKYWQCLKSGFIQLVDHFGTVFGLVQASMVTASTLQDGNVYYIVPAAREGLAGRIEPLHLAIDVTNETPEHREPSGGVNTTGIGERRHRRNIPRLVKTSAVTSVPHSLFRTVKWEADLSLRHDSWEILPLTLPKLAICHHPDLVAMIVGERQEAHHPSLVAPGPRPMCQFTVKSFSCPQPFDALDTFIKLRSVATGVYWRADAITSV